MERRVTVRGIIKKDGKIFAQRLKNKEGVNNFWCTPGGGLDSGESLLDGLHRELIEETGVEPVVGPLLYIQQYRDDKREYLEFFFEIRNPEDYEMINLANTSHGEIEVAHYGFIDPGSEFILPEFLQKERFDTTPHTMPVMIMDNLNEEK